jgi:hypothetical protein
MSTKVWIFSSADDHHIVELNYNKLTLSGNIVVDGNQICKWGWSLKSKVIPFKVGDKEVVMKFIVNHLSRNKQELYVDGVIM